MLITFIYTLFNGSQKYYGKFVGNISYLMYTVESVTDTNNVDIYGLIKMELLLIIQKQYRMSNINLEDIELGIISINELNSYYSLEEKKIFDVLIIYNDFNKLIYVDGYNSINDTNDLTESEVSSNDSTNDIINQNIEID